MFFFLKGFQFYWEKFSEYIFFLFITQWFFDLKSVNLLNNKLYCLDMKIEIKNKTTKIHQVNIVTPCSCSYHMETQLYWNLLEFFCCYKLIQTVRSDVDRWTILSSKAAKGKYYKLFVKNWKSKSFLIIWQFILFPEIKIDWNYFEIVFKMYFIN